MRIGFSYVKISFENKRRKKPRKLQKNRKKTEIKQPKKFSLCRKLNLLSHFEVKKYNSIKIVYYQGLFDSGMVCNFCAMKRLC